MRNLALVLIVFMLCWTGTAFATSHTYNPAGPLVFSAELWRVPRALG